MNAQEAISQLSNALAIVNQESFDKETIRTLTKFVDDKHKQYIERGLMLNDRHLIMHGIVGALSHYEAEKDKEKFEKKISSIAQDS
ncbi:MAG: hypothetical protein NTW67_03545 [Candidatus Woesearchaeota archaeon]|nr:hypothetical protein [Candidatus Woesearchaeota archaeon]